MQVTLVQYAPIWEDRRATRAKLEGLLAGIGPTDWIVFPEMALSGFSMDLSKTTWDAEDYTFFQGLARDRACQVTVGGVEGGQNIAFAISPAGEIAARYAKRHLFSFAGEDGRYRPGKDNAAYRVAGLRVSQAICYDLRFPNHFWGEAGDTQAYCVIAAWGGKRSEHWKTLLRARAIENQAFMVGVNRIGEEPTTRYSGDSAIIGPQGETILDCGGAEGVFSAQIDAARVDEWRAAFPAIKDRTP